nr:MAG TPA: hypothetical protein [Caudoviricetes sp.]
MYESYVKNILALKQYESQRKKHNGIFMDYINKCHNSISNCANP